MKTSAQVGETLIRHDDSAMCKTLVAVCLMSLLSTFALALPPADNKQPGIEIKDYPGNTPATEKVAALSLKGDAKAGHADYRAHCQACHMPSGSGSSDGSIPQLAGQHSSVVIKQLTDIRSGLRNNPTMYPYARKLSDPQAIANVAAYIATLCVPGDSGKYQGPDAASQIAKGKLLYEKECAQCHQSNGEGLKEMFYPVLARQHYQYLLRQMTEIHSGTRSEVPQEMFKVITKYNKPQLVAIAAYQASLASGSTMPGATMWRCPS